MKFVRLFNVVHLFNMHSNFLNFFYDNNFLNKQFRNEVTGSFVNLIQLIIECFLNFFFFSLKITIFLIFIFLEAGLTPNNIYISLSLSNLYINEKFIHFIKNDNNSISLFQCLYFGSLNFNLYLVTYLRIYYFYVTPFFIFCLYNEPLSIYLK